MSTKHTQKTRRTIAILLAIIATIVLVCALPEFWQEQAVEDISIQQPTEDRAFVRDVLETIEIKGRAPRTGYSRSEFGSGWATSNGCDMRNTILARDLERVAVDDDCRVVSGVLDDPYTGETIEFRRGPGTSSEVQIDHVVALSDAWQKGAQQLPFDRREQFANDPLNLLAVDGPANQQKSDSDAASWLPAYRPFRCQFVARQVAVKAAYGLWMTAAEKQAIDRVLTSCPNQKVPLR